MSGRWCLKCVVTCRESTGGPVSLTCATQGEAFVTADAAVATALAINELVTNSIKQLSRVVEACITVNCHVEAGWAIIAISDNGPGFPANFDISKVKGFGLRMVQRVVSGAGGELQLSQLDGRSVVEIRLPTATPKARN